MPLLAQLLGHDTKSSGHEAAGSTRLFDFVGNLRRCLEVAMDWLSASTSALGISIIGAAPEAPPVPPASPAPHEPLPEPFPNLHK